MHMKLIIEQSHHHDTSHVQQFIHVLTRKESIALERPFF